MASSISCQLHHSFNKLFKLKINFLIYSSCRYRFDHFTLNTNFTNNCVFYLSVLLVINQMRIYLVPLTINKFECILAHLQYLPFESVFPQYCFCFLFYYRVLLCFQLNLLLGTQILDFLFFGSQDFHYHFGIFLSRMELLSHLEV